MPASARAALPPETTASGAMARLFLLETTKPQDPRYDRTKSLEAMRLMRQTIENRLASPRHYMAAGAQDETDIIRLGNQFAGFDGYPILSSKPSIELKLLNEGARSNPDIAQFIADAVTVATEPNPSPAVQFRNVSAWRTEHSRSPGPRFRKLITIQGNDFYETLPPPPMPKVKHHIQHRIHHR